MAASLKVSELTALTSVAASDLILVSDVDVSVSKKVTLANLQGSMSLASLGTKSIGDLTDVDITTAAPSADQYLVWDGSNFVPGSGIFTLIGEGVGDTDLGIFTGDIIPDNATIRSALQAIETKIEDNDQAAATESAVSEIDTNVDDLRLCVGATENVQHIGSFTGSTITDDQTVKSALQELETAVELKANTTTVTETNLNVGDLISLSGSAENATNLGVFTGDVISNSTTIRAALQELETAIEAEATNRATAISDLVDGAPDALNTLNELAAAINDDASAAATLNAAIAANETHIDNMADLTGMAKDSLHLSTFTGSIISDDLDIKGALQEIETFIEESDSNSDDLITLSGVGENSTTLGTFTGSTIADSQSIKQALQALETKAEANANAVSSEATSRANADTTLTNAQTEINTNVDDLITLSGIDENVTDLGEFTGSTISDNETIKDALQALETAVETKVTTGANVNTLVGATSADTEPASYLFLVVNAADGTIKAISKEFVETEGSN